MNVIDVPNVHPDIIRRILVRPYHQITIKFQLQENQFLSNKNHLINNEMNYIMISNPKLLILYW